MKNQNLLNKRLILIIVTISVFSFLKTLGQTADNPHRGMYVDKFVKYDNAGNYLPQFSILGVDEDLNGVFEKEDELLSYAQQNHFTSLTLYELPNIFSNSAPKVWNNNTARFEDLKEHLCRFIQKAKSQYKIDEIFAAAGSGEDADSVQTLGSIFKTSTPKFEFSDEEKALPSYTSRLQQITDQYPTTSSLFLISEISKFILRVAHFEGCQNQIQFNGFSAEHEFWNNSKATNDNDACDLDTLLRDLDTIKANFLGSHPNSSFSICVYYGKASVSTTTLTCPDCVAEDIDGVTSVHSSCTVTPNYCTGNSTRKADKIYFEKYLRNVGQFTTQRKEVIFSSSTTKDSTTINPLFSAQSKINGSTNDFFGDWILGGYGTSGVDNNQLRNIFQAEKFHYYDWKSYKSNLPSENIEKPGAVQWYSSSFLLKSFKNTPLFFADYNGCLGTPSLTFTYSGPREKNITYTFSVTTSGGSLTPLSGTGFSSGETPEDTVGIPDFLLDYNISGAGSSDSCIATIILNFDNGTPTVSYTQIIKLGKANISAVNSASSKFNICDGETILLRASISNATVPAYQWQSSSNGTVWVSIANNKGGTSQFYNATEAGFYRCLVKCGTANDTSNIINILIKENPYVLITNQCGSRTLKANNGGLIGYAPGSFTYLWSDGSTADSTVVPTSNAPSSYNVIVTNLTNGCIASNSIRVSNPLPTSNPITILVDSVSCTSGLGYVELTLDTVTSNDVVKGIISDGTTTFYQTWTTGSGTTKKISGLSPGKYHVAVNNNGKPCSATASFTIGDTLTFVRPVDISITNTSCKDSLNGEVQFTLATSGLSFEWAGSVSSSNVTITSTYIRAVGFKKGTYFLKIYNNSCQFQYVSFTISEPAGIAVTYSTTPVNCNLDSTGAINQTLSGSGYSYLWDYQSQTGQDIDSIPSGVYNCTITSSGGCKQTFTYFVDQSHPMILQENEITGSCISPVNGKAKFLIYGGTPITTGSVAYTITSVPSATWSHLTGKRDEFEGVNLSATTYTLTVSDKYCTQVFTISIPSNGTSAGVDQTLCSTSSASLAAVNPSVGTGTWSVIAGGGALDNSGDPLSGVTGLSRGINTFVWTISGGVCSPSTDTVNITVDTLAYAGLNQTICSSTTTLAAKIPILGSGTWSQVSGTASIFSTSNPSTVVSGLKSGINTFVWTISGGACSLSRDTVLIIVDTLANAGVDQNICTTTIPNLSAKPAILGTGNWSFALGSGTITNINLPTSTVTSLSIGLNKLVWTVSGGTCATSRDTVIIHVDDIPSNSHAGSDQTICGQTTVLEGNVALIGTGLWTKISGSGSISTTNSPTSVLTGLSGITPFIWTISNGVCPQSKDTMVVYATGLAELSTSVSPNTKYSVDSDYTLASNITLTGDTILVASGKKIIVPSGKILTITSNSYLKNCNNMWVGIEVRAGGKIELDGNSKIEGAQYGINILDSSDYKIKEATFNRNYVGINFKGYSHLVYGPNAYNKLKFDCSKSSGVQDTLPPPYVGQTPAIGTKGFAGIKLQGSFVDLSPYSVDSLNFNNLSNGIVCNNAYLRIEKCVFSNIHADATYNSYMPQNVNGVGVNVNNTTLGTATLRGFDLISGSVDSLKTNFRSCDTAIVVIGRSAMIYNNRTENVSVGFRTTTTDGYCVIYDNRLRVKHIGVNILHSDLANLVSVNYNKIIVGEGSSSSAGNVGINFNMMNNSSILNAGASSNLINLYGAENGIAFNNLRNGLAKDNSINIITTLGSINSIGISLTGCKSLKLDGNTIIGSDTGDVRQKGIYISSSDSSKLYCNYTNQTFEGILANAINVNCDLRSNTMHNHAYGLHLNSGAKIGLHFYKGNLWDGSYSRKAAKNEDFVNYLNSQFRVQDTVLAHFLLPRSFFPIFMFIAKDSINDFKCSDFTRGGGGGLGDDGGGIDELPIDDGQERMITNEDIAAAEGDSVQYDRFQIENNYILDQNLYQKLKNFPELQATQLMADFYLENVSSAIGTLNEVNESTLYTLSERIPIESQLDSLHDSISNVIAEMGTSTNENTIKQLALETTILQNEIEVKTINLKSTKALLMDNLLSSNSAVNNYQPIESYEKIVNEIYLSTIAKDIFDFTSSQKSTLYEIAHLCPLSGGKAVYSARSIYAIIDDRQYYDDDNVCQQAETARKSTKIEIDNKTIQKSNGVKISPNPADNDIQIDFDGQANLNLEIYDAMSKLILTAKLNSKKTSEKIFINSLQNGVYFLKLFSNGKQIKQEKLIIMH